MWGYVFCSRYPQPCIYTGDFNCHSTTWGYSSTNPDGAALEDWASMTDLSLVHDPKQPGSFRSARWGTTTNPDLAFANLGLHTINRRVLDQFPKSQHRPSIIESSAAIKTVPTRPVKRWNFRKADWDSFTDHLNLAANQLPSPASDPDSAYSAWCSTILAAAKKSIPRGCRAGLIPTWDDECQQLYDHFIRAAPGADANERAVTLTKALDEKRRSRWETSTENINFSHSSRIAWQSFNRLTGRAKKTQPCPVSANAIASKLIANGRHTNVDKQVSRDVNAEIARLRASATPVPGSLSEPFSAEETTAAVKLIKSGKAQGPDKIAPEFITHCGSHMLTWLRVFFSQCMSTLRLPKIWRRSEIIAILKPKKPADDAKSYRPISLLCVPLKLLERLMLARLDPVIDPQLPPQQAGFRRRGPCGPDRGL